MKCENCDKIFSTDYDLSTHMPTVHMWFSFKCNICDITCSSKETLEKHIGEHTSSLTDDVDNIHNNIENNAIALTTNRKEVVFECTECNNTSLSKIEHEYHVDNEHGVNTAFVRVRKDYLEHLEKERDSLKNEVLKLSEDFERLQSIFEISKNASNKDNHEIEAELSEARDQFKVVKEENVYLKEKNDTLFKLGKMALDNVKSKEPILEIIEDEDEDGLEALVQSVVQNKQAQKNVGTVPKVASNVDTSNKQKSDRQPQKKSSHIEASD